MIVVLNDNEMSIAPNVGALSNYLTHLRISAGWQSAKRKARSLNRIPLVGKPVYKILHGTKKLVKSFFVRDTELGFFDALGFEYFGPINGHDLAGMEKTFRQAQQYKGPCVIHVLTKKGYGYNKAEERPETFHGTPPFYVETGYRIDTPSAPSCGHIMADTLAELSGKDSRIVAITAAMKLGTGLDHYAEHFPDRLIDVGIAEEHAATMAAGLASGGMRPYVAVYASFFQRCYDQMLHDVCMQHLPVVFLLDRSGIGGEDGQTHHGLFDLSITLPVPGLTVLSPSTPEELTEMIKWTVNHDGPCIIRYPKALKTPAGISDINHFTSGKWKELTKRSSVILLSTGSMVQRALDVYEILKKHGIDTTVVNCSTIKPIDTDFLRSVPEETKVFTMEEHMLTGGFGEFVTSFCLKNAYNVPVHCFGVTDSYIQHGNHELLMRDSGLDADTMSGVIQDYMKGAGAVG